MKIRAFAFRAAAGFLVVSAASAACGDRELTVGSGPPAEVGSQGTAGNPPSVWAGYVESFTFKSGSDRITATFTSPTSGTVVFGDDAADPPSVDPSVGYPPGCSFRPSLPPQGPDHPSRCAERFAFTMRDAIQERDRLRFSVDVVEMWATWCEGQTLITIPGWLGTGIPSSYSCAGVAPGTGGACQVVRALPDGGPSMDVPQDGGMPTPRAADTFVDCNVQATCATLCSCTATGCERGKARLVSFDLHVDGDQAAGSSDLGSVRLKAR